jgi:hypothetical protein
MNKYADLIILGTYIFCFVGTGILTAKMYPIVRSSNPPLTDCRGYYSFMIALVVSFLQFLLVASIVRVILITNGVSLYDVKDAFQWLAEHMFDHCKNMGDLCL